MYWGMEIHHVKPDDENIAAKYVHIVAIIVGGSDTWMAMDMPKQ